MPDGRELARDERDMESSWMADIEAHESFARPSRTGERLARARSEIVDKPDERWPSTATTTTTGMFNVHKI